MGNGKHSSLMAAAMDIYTLLLHSRIGSARVPIRIMYMRAYVIINES